METQIMLGFEGLPYTSDDFYTAQILASVLGGGMSSRLFQEVREKRGLCYSIYAFHWGFADTGIFGVHAATGPDDVAELMPVMLGELERAAHDIDERELDRARAQLRAGLLMTLESPAARAGQLARQILLFGRPIPIEELVAKIEAISVGAVRDLAGAIITGSAPTIAAGRPGERHDEPRQASPTGSAHASWRTGPPWRFFVRSRPTTLTRPSAATASCCARRRSATIRNGRGSARRADRSWRRGSRSGRATT